MNELEAALTELIARLSVDAEAVYSETANVCRLDRGICGDAECFEEIKRVAIAFTREWLGITDLYAEVGGQIDLATAAFNDVRGDRVSLVVTKSGGPQWRWFLREDALFHELDNDDFALATRAVWIGGEFGEFTTRIARFSRWGGPRDYHVQRDGQYESPRKLVRDRSHQSTPSDLRPWLVAERSRTRSSVFEGWRRLAIRHLAFSIPFEVVPQTGHTAVVLKGPRSTTILIEFAVHAYDDVIFDALAAAAEWIYATPRDAETKFTFLNYHLSLDWRDGESWPLGITSVFVSALASARDAFAFHLQDQTRDALKSLADLRKTLQEEVAKAQQATRDLLTSLWRDFAIAAAVLALRYVPTGTDLPTTPPEWLRGVTAAAAVMLTVSLVVTIASGARYNYLADAGRTVWRRKIYSFIPDDEWKRLVSEPIGKALAVFWMVMIPVALVYLAIILFLLYVAFPGWSLWVYVQ